MKKEKKETSEPIILKRNSRNMITLEVIPKQAKTMSSLRVTDSQGPVTETDNLKPKLASDAPSNAGTSNKDSGK